MLSFSVLSRLPTSLLSLLIAQVSFALAQTQQLAINQSLSLDSKSLPNPPRFNIPSSSTPLYISVALCSSSIPGGPRFFVTNNSAIGDPGPTFTIKDGVYEIQIGDNGIGNVTLEGLSNGGAFGVTLGSGSETFEVGLSDTGPLHSVLPTIPLFGDTTADQVLLFSPPFLPQPIQQPTYPNYTLPPANLSVPPHPPQVTNFSLILGPTTSFPAFNVTSKAFGGLPLTACALRNVSGLMVGGGSAGNVQESLVSRDERGWRTQWIVEGLQRQVNYTAFVVQDGVKVAGPVSFTTKSAAFACPLVHSLPFCPLTSYAVPLPPPPGTATTYDASNFPDTVSGPLLAYLTNFTTSLLSFPCGRDWYSPLKSCADCQVAYRTWLCAISLPRCGEEPQQSTQIQRARGLTGKEKRADSQVPLSNSGPALQPQNSSLVRNPNLPAINGGSWTALLPCLETCNAVDRSCPYFLGFQCPLPKFNADQSYGVGYVDGDAHDHGGDWVKGGGWAGAAQDRWGNVWCNGPGLSD